MSKFSPYSKPTLYAIEPTKTYKRDKLIEQLNISPYSKFIAPDGTKKIEITDVTGHDDIELEISFYGEEEELINKNYEKEMAEYTKKKIAYKKSLEEWNEQKKIYDAKKVIEDELAEKALLTRLKKKYPQLAEA